MNPEEDDLFADDDADKKMFHPKGTWKVLIVDDEADVHQMTQFVLNDFTFTGSGLNIIDVYSAAEARETLKNHADIAAILLDVVMESNDAGLQLVDYIRNKLDNHFVRIILRTGQAGIAPEKEVIRKYDINDYANKADLTAKKLFTLITTALRTYSDIVTIESQRHILEKKVVERTRELQEKNSALLKLNQEKDEFLGIAARDLKNPLSAIQGLAQEVLNICTPASEQIRVYAEMIHTSSWRMSALINKLLDVNEIESGEVKISPQIVDLLPITQTLLDQYAGSAKAKNISLELQGGHCQAFVDNCAVQQVLDNLISNAVKYSPHGTRVSVRLILGGEENRCEVEDQGPGLSDSDKKRLFGKFTRLSARPTGDEHATGLGLFIVRKLVEAMNARVYCESALGHGATFIVSFPAEAPPPPPSAQKKYRQGENQRIILAEGGG